MSLHSGQKWRRQKVEGKTRFETFENHPKVRANNKIFFGRKIKKRNMPILHFFRSE